MNNVELHFLLCTVFSFIDYIIIRKFTFSIDYIDIKLYFAKHSDSITEMLHNNSSLEELWFYYMRKMFPWINGQPEFFARNLILIWSINGHALYLIGHFAKSSRLLFNKTLWVDDFRTLGHLFVYGYEHGRI